MAEFDTGLLFILTDRESPTLDFHTSWRGFVINIKAEKSPTHGRSFFVRLSDSLSKSCLPMIFFQVKGPHFLLLLPTSIFLREPAMVHKWKKGEGKGYAVKYRQIVYSIFILSRRALFFCIRRAGMNVGLARCPTTRTHSFFSRIKPTRAGQINVKDDA